MDSRISSASRPDIVLIESTARPTPAPARISFGQVLAAGAGSLVQGAELAATHLPGAPVAAAAIRSSAALSLQGVAFGGLSGGATAEGPAVGTGLPGATGLGGGVPTGLAFGSGSASAAPPTGDATGGIDASIQQSAELSMYYLQIQQAVDAQNRSFTALSNVLKTQHDSAKAAIQNIHS